MMVKIMNKLKYIAYFIGMIVLTSCNDWLDVEPETSVDEKKLFSTEQGFKDAMAGNYAIGAFNFKRNTNFLFRWIQRFQLFFQCLQTKNWPFTASLQKIKKR